MVTLSIKTTAKRNGYRWVGIGILALVLSIFMVHAETRFTGAALDQKKIHKAYSDGDFEKVTSQLEGYMKENKTWSRVDSIFICKHLGVVYTANPDTREKGKYYLFSLLELVPSARLVDMFVSDDIDRVFEKVREEHAERHKSSDMDMAVMRPPQPIRESGTSSGQITTTSPRTKEKDSHWSTTWLAASGGLVVAGVATYYLLQSSKKGEDVTYDVP